MITFDRAELARALAIVSKATPKIAHNPVIYGVLIECTERGAALTCTDLDLTITTTLEVEADADVDLVVGTKLLAAFAGRAQGDTVTLEVDDDQVVVRSGRARAKLTPLVRSEWPRIGATPVDGAVTLSAADLSAIRRVLPMASRDLSRPMITGVAFLNGRASATSSYHGAHADLVAEIPDLNVPAAAVATALDGADEVRMSWDANRVAFNNGTTTWTTRLIPEEPPALDGLIRASSPLRVTVDLEQLRHAVAVASVARDDGDPVRLAVEEDAVIVRARTVDVGEASEALDAEVHGEPFDSDIGFNPTFLAQVLGSVESEVVTLEMATPGKPVVVNDGALVGLVMPVRIGTA